MPYDSVIPLLGIYLKECKSGYNRDTWTLMFIAVLFTIAKLSKQPRCPTTNNGLSKCDIYIIYIYMLFILYLYNIYIYTYLYKMEYYSAIRKNK
jgi:hypothetical protein